MEGFMELLNSTKILSELLTKFSYVSEWEKPQATAANTAITELFCSKKDR